MDTGSAIGNVIAFFMSNFTLTFLIVGLVFALVGIARAPKPPGEGVVVEELFRWFLFWAIGVAHLYNAVFHVFFGRMAAEFIGWADSPFQLEVGFASLGFALVGFLAFRGGREVRLAAVVGPAAFLWGAAGGHVYQMMTEGDFSPGNAGIIFWTDILIPVIGFVLWGMGRKTERA